MTRGLGDLLSPTKQRTFTSNLLPIYLGAPPVLYSFRAEIHVAQIRRYENGETQPALDVIRRLAIAFNVSADMLVFDVNERRPDDDFLLQFEAISRFDAEEKKIIKALLEGMILKHETKRIAQM